MSLEGKQLGRYHLRRLLGSGGMGEVYLAEDPRISQRVAIKVIHAELSPYPNMQETAEATRLFRREASAIAQLDHPRILPLYDFGEEHIDGMKVTYLAIPFREEGSFADWLQRRSNAEPLPPEDVCYFLNQMAEALQYVHGHQIIHRDVKPSNFLIRENKEHPSRPDLVLADFGVAQIIGTTSASLSVRGTPNYMAPEQWAGHPVPATDQYALAIIAYELLTGQFVFQGSLQTVMYHHLHTPPIPVSQINPHIPTAADAVLLRALAKRPEERYPSVSAFVQNLQQALLSQPQSGSGSASSDQHTITEPPQRETSPSINVQQIGQALPSDIPTSLGSRPDQAPPQQGIASSEEQNQWSPPPHAFSTPSSYPPNIPAQELPAPGRQDQESPIYPLPPYQPTIIPPPPPPPKRRQRISTPVVVLLAGLAVLVTVGCCALSFSSLVSRLSNIQESSTPTPGSSVTPGTSTSGSQWKTVLDDPLHDNSKGNSWAENNYCQFSNGAYYANIEKASTTRGCLSQKSFRDFWYQVQITIDKGDCGGITFRSASDFSAGYIFEVCQNGSYSLSRFDSSSTTLKTLTEGNSPSIHRGLGQTNMVGVVATEDKLALYINGTDSPVTTFNDSTYNQGVIGVVADDISNPTLVHYANAQVSV